MSLKKDRFSSFDKNNMRFAINLAINQNGLTGTNPSVGCVIVKKKKNNFLWCNQFKWKTTC